MVEILVVGCCCGGLVLIKDYSFVLILFDGLFSCEEVVFVVFGVVFGVILYFGGLVGDDWYLIYIYVYY